MNVNTLLRKELILFSELDGKRDNLEALIRSVEQAGLVKDGDELRQSVFSREELMSTGIGLGIAVPHVRINGVENIIIAISINKKGIDDYDALDGEPVKIIIMIIANEKQHKDYLMLLAQMVKILKKDSMIANLLETQRPEEVIQLISDDPDGNVTVAEEPGANGR